MQSEAGHTPEGMRADAEVDLLGVLAYGELTAFNRLAADAWLAPTLSGRAALARMAAAEIGHFGRLVERLETIGVSPDEAMEPFVAPLDAFHESTLPGTWLEGLVKAYVFDGIAADFYSEIAGWLPVPTHDLVLDVLKDTGYAAFAVHEVTSAIGTDDRLGARLSLWSRRLLGEALSQAQHIAAERDALTELIITESGDLTGVGALFRRLTDAHSARMRTLGLSG